MEPRSRWSAHAGVDVNAPVNATDRFVELIFSASLLHRVVVIATVVKHMPGSLVAQW